jgi:hypothetical protein
MASELKVDKFTGVTTAGSILVTGEGNSTTTNLQQGLVKMWSHHTQASTYTLDDSFNQASLTDVDTGQSYLTFTNPPSNDKYSCSMTAGSSNNRRAIFTGNTTERVHVVVYQVASNTSAIDGPDVCCQVVGDLA